VRRRYVDWLRAIAVLIMIEAHTLDAWTRPSSRTGRAFRDLTILGGFAAPLFLWLAGLALVLSAERTAEQTGDRRAAMAAVCRRGLEIFILAFLFRLQAFIVSPGSWPVMIFKVDILNIMGPAMVAAGLLWGLTGGAKKTMMVLTAAGAVTAMVTPLVRSAHWVDLLPIWVQWYLRPAADLTTFSMFPWSAFVFAGGAVGVLLVSARSEGERRLQIALALAGAILIAIGFGAARQPTIYGRGESAFWTSSPTFFAIRLGVIVCALPAAYFLNRWLARRSLELTVLERLGRSSLFVYWIHVELVYGYATWLLHRRLTLWQLALAYSVFTAAMYGAVVLKDRALAAWRARRALGRPVQSAIA